MTLLSDEFQKTDQADPDRQAHQCAECHRDGVAGDDWKCPHCSQSMRFGYRYHPCNHCGREAFWTRVRNRYDNHCLCNEAPEQRKARLDDEAIRDRRERKEFDENNRRSDLQLARVLTQALMDGAKNCWMHEKRGKCSVSQSEVNQTGGPRDFCRVCPKFVKDPNRNNKTQKEQ